MIWNNSHAYQENRAKKFKNWSARTNCNITGNKIHKMTVVNNAAPAPTIPPQNMVGQMWPQYGGFVVPPMYPPQFVQPQFVPVMPQPQPDVAQFQMQPGTPQLQPGLHESSMPAELIYRPAINGRRG